MKRIYNNTSIASHKGVPRREHHYLTGLARMGITLVALAVVMAIMPHAGSAQTGTITGTVTDMQTGEPLPGARVELAATGQSVAADKNGRYILHRVPSGNQTLSVRYLGYSSDEVSVSVGSAERVAQRVGLEPAFLNGDDKFVETTQRSKVHAMNRNHRSAARKSSISSNEMGLFTDYTVRQGLIRLPGVQASADGGINIRGAAPAGYPDSPQTAYRNGNVYAISNSVTLDGQRLATTGMGVRSVDLDIFSADMVREVEIIKVPTPDMDADGLGGTVNLKTYHAIGGERQIDVRLGGGANTRYFLFTGPATRASVYYTEPIMEGLGLAINLGHQGIHRSWERLDMDYQTHDFGSGAEDVLERVSPGLHNDRRKTFSGRVQLTYQPSDEDTYYIRSFMIDDDREITRHMNSAIANGDWINQDTTGATGGTGIFRADTKLDEINTRHYNLQAGGRHLFNAFNLDYHAGWSGAQTKRRELSFPFERTSGINYAIDMSNRQRPVMSVLDNRFILDNGSFRRAFLTMGEFERIMDKHNDNTFTGGVDIEIPYGLGAFKVGSSVRVTNKTGKYDEIGLFYVRNFNMESFNMRRQRDVNILDQYLLPWLLETDAMRTFFEARRPVFTRADEDRDHQRSDIWNYEASENIYAGYGMATVELGMLTLRGGARVEQTDAQYDGRKVMMDTTGVFDSYINNTAGNDYLNVFPNAQLEFTLASQTNIHLAYSKTISRPDFNQLAPFELTNPADSTLLRGNPGIEPVISNNFDLHVDQYMSEGLGSMSLGVFYKELSNFVTLQERTINVREGDFAGYDPAFENPAVTEIPVNEMMFRNSDNKASLYGVELAWQQQFTFLPGFLGRFGTHANYTWSELVYKTDRSEDVTLPYQSPHVINAALDYTAGRIYAQVSYYRAAGSLVSPGESGPAPSVSSGNVFLDRYQDGWTDLAVSFRFRLSDHFRFWADVFNLLGNEFVQYEHTREFYPTQIDRTGGAGFRTGVRYNL